MGFRNKIIAAAFAVLIGTSVFTITAYATPTDSDIVTDIPGEGEGEVDVTDPYVPDDPYAGEETIPPEEPVTDDPYAESDPYYEPETEAPYYEPTDPYYEPEYPEYTTYPYAQYEEPDVNNNYENNNQGGNAVYNEPLPTVELYDSDREISDDELSKNDWNEIAANLAKSSANTDGDDGGDFNFIKKNDSRSDNGGWILIVGIVLILLSIAGISYTVVSTVKNRKSTAGFSSDKNNVTFASKSKFDTAEVKLPKRAKHSGGKRFK